MGTVPGTILGPGRSPGIKRRARRAERKVPDLFGQTAGETENTLQWKVLPKRNKVNFIVAGNPITRRIDQAAGVIEFGSPFGRLARIGRSQINRKRGVCLEVNEPVAAHTEAASHIKCGMTRHHQAFATVNAEITYIAVGDVTQTVSVISAEDIGVRSRGRR